MKQRKIFIGIQLPEYVKKRLSEKMEKWRDFPIRWSFGENLHITLLFIGYINDEAMIDICDRTKEAAKKSGGFDIKFEKIGFGPDGKNPRMVWLSGEANENLKNLITNLENEMGITRTFRNEIRPHVTLGRIRQSAWKNLPEPPEVTEKFSVSVPASEITVFESVLEKGKRKFIALESCPLK